MRRSVPVLTLLLIVGCNPRSPGSEPDSVVSPLEGQFEYVGSLKGQASLVDGRYLFLFGAPSDTASMTANAGTYVIAHDTGTGRVVYSTDRNSVGTTFRWTAIGWSGDTVSYVVTNDSGRVTGQGRAVKRRN